jgi:nucleoside-diphosphate-sugar epimerase
MKNILLLGGSGYIGSKFYDKFYSVYNIDSIDLQLFNTDNHSVRINYNNLTDITKYDIILCFAAHSSVQMCEYAPERSWINNVEYFKNLCNKLQNHQKFIYMSSASVYGNTTNIATEKNDLNINPIQNYDLQKIVIDIIANKFMVNNKNIIGLRLGTVNGSSPYTRKELMLNSMVYNALENKEIVIKNLNMKRSILGIDDLMRALDTIINNEIESGQYNLCSFTLNVGQMANEIKKICSTKTTELPSDKIFYSFEMSTEKFCKNYNFEFQDTPTSIIKNLIDNHFNTIYSERMNDANFINYL